MTSFELNNLLLVKLIWVLAGKSVLFEADQPAPPLILQRTTTNITTNFQAIDLCCYTAGKNTIEYTENIIDSTAIGYGEKLRNSKSWQEPDMTGFSWLLLSLYPLSVFESWDSTL